MKHILLPTDFSSNSWNAIEYALNFYKNEVCNFYIVHIIKLHQVVNSNGICLSPDDDMCHLSRKPAEEQLEEMVDKIKHRFSNTPHHHFYTITDYNSFIGSIRKYVKEKKIDTIVMGAKGVSRLRQLILGSNTSDVITKVKCNTLVVPEDAKFKLVKNIAFPTDYLQSYNKEKLEPILDVLKQKESCLRIIHINKESGELNQNQLQKKELLKTLFDKYCYSFHNLTHKNVEEAIQSFVKNKDTDMMVMVAKNLNYFQQIFFHSKVEKISYHTNLPLLVLHE